jgi:hypothetical protein
MYKKPHDIDDIFIYNIRAQNYTPGLYVLPIPEISLKGIFNFESRRDIYMPVF